MSHKRSPSAVIVLFVAASSVIAGAPLPFHRPRGVLADTSIAYGKPLARPGGDQDALNHGQVARGASIGGDASEGAGVDPRNLFVLHSPKSLLARHLHAKHRNRRVFKGGVFQHDGVDHDRGGVNVPVVVLSPSSKETNIANDHSESIPAPPDPIHSSPSSLNLEGLDLKRDDLLDGYGNANENLENGYGSLSELDGISSLTSVLSSLKRNNLLDGYGNANENLKNGYGSLPELDPLLPVTEELLGELELKRADLLDGYGTPAENLENGYGSLDSLDLTTLGLVKRMATRSLHSLSPLARSVQARRVHSSAIRKQRSPSLHVAGIDIPDGLNVVPGVSTLGDRDIPVAGINVPDGYNTPTELVEELVNLDLAGDNLYRRERLGDAIDLPVLDAADSPVLDEAVVLFVAQPTAATSSVQPVPQGSQPSGIEPVQSSSTAGTPGSVPVNHVHNTDQDSNLSQAATVLSHQHYEI